MHDDIPPDLNTEPAGLISYDTEYETGQDNVRFLGMDLHNPVFFISAATILLFIIGALLFPIRAGDLLIGAKTLSQKILNPPLIY